MDRAENDREDPVPPRRLLLVASPGGGKSVQGREVAAALGVPHVSSGAMLRAEVERGSDVGRGARAAMERGDLVPSDVVARLVEERLARPDARGGYVLDGFPRDLDQAEALERRAGAGVIERVVVLNVPNEELLRRLEDRRDRRADDRAEVIAHRLDLYARRIRPLLDHYRARGTLLEVDGAGPPQRVTAHILDALRA